MIVIKHDQLEGLLDFPEIIDALLKGFRKKINVPPRSHFNYKNRPDDSTATLLLMPAWGYDGFMGLKTITVTPGNHIRNLPSIQGIYLLMNMTTGQVTAQIDAPCLTNFRTAGASAVASMFLSRNNSSRLLMVGTGSLAPYLVRAHAAVRPLKKVMIWGRNFNKASLLAERLNSPSLQVMAIHNLDAMVPEADIISTATMSEEPLIRGSLLCSGQHLDLVGSYRPDMREADDDVIIKASIFIDTKHGMLESGDLKQPLDAGIIREGDIKGVLFRLCRKEVRGRINKNELTLFKSVGHASEDLIIAVHAYRKMLSGA